MLINIERAKEILPFKKSTIRLYCSKNQIPHRHVRGKVLFDEDDLALWCADGGKIDLHFKIVGSDVIRK